MSENIKVSSKIKLLPHNQELYDKIVEQIEKGEKSIFYSQATGLGKSFIFMKLVEDYFQGKRIMYVVPKIAIWENLIRYKEFETLDATIDMYTYQSFNTYDSSLVDKYDVVFIDECHHMLSDIQGTNIMTYCLDMNSDGKFTFGFTATPYYQDKYVDEECFDVSCYGYDVYEAINKGLLPKIKLALANIDLDTIPWDLKVQFSITGTKSLLHKITKEHTEIHRWIAYFPSKKELEIRAHELSILFPNYKILKTYIGCKYDELIIDEFNNYDGNVILLSVNRLLEGVHLKNVQGVLLYRNVVEFSTYMQMYGRLCDINSKFTPLFLDVSNALLSLKGISESKSSKYIGERRVYKYKDIFDINASDYWTIELAELLRKSNRPWTEEENEILKQYYPVEHCKAFERIKDRTYSACKQQIRKLGLCGDTFWTEEEDAIIIKYYKELGADIQDMLPERSYGAIMQRAAKLGVGKLKARLTQEELNRLASLYESRKYGNLLEMFRKEFPGRSNQCLYSGLIKLGYNINNSNNYSEEEKDYIALLIKDGLDIKAIVSKVNGLPKLKERGIKRTVNGLSDFISREESFFVSEDDIELIRKHYQTEGKKIFQRLSQKYLSGQQIILARKYGGLKTSKWTDEEDKVLKDNFVDMHDSVHTLLPGRTLKACYARARILGLVEKGRWTEEDDAIIKQNLNKSNLQIAELIPGRTAGQISYRISRLKLRDRGIWLDEEDNLILKLKANGYNYDIITKEVNELNANIKRGVVRSKDSIRNRYCKVHKLK